jgi:hypothetical protein
MNAHRMDQETVERLLGGPADDAQDGPRSLVLLLTAVRAAPHADELAGEAAAVHAYRRARAGSPVDVPRSARRRFGRLTVRVVLAGVLVAGTGGVAFAAAGAVLPNPLRTPAPSTGPSSAAPGATVSPTGDAGPPSAAPSAATGGPDPSAALVGLCAAYRADAGDDPGRALDAPAFGDLIGAAGGRDRVAGYCDTVLTGSPGPATPENTRKGTPTSRPDNQPTGRPTVPPTVPPTAEPPGTAGPPPAPTTRRPTAPGTVPATPGGTDQRTPTVPSGGTRG